MNSIKLADCNTQLKQVTEDLRAIQTVMATVEGEKAISCEREALMVVQRALDPIISDLENVVQTLDSELNRDVSM